MFAANAHLRVWNSVATPLDCHGDELTNAIWIKADKGILLYNALWQERSCIIAAQSIGGLSQVMEANWGGASSQTLPQRRAVARVNSAHRRRYVCRLCASHLSWQKEEKRTGQQTETETTKKVPQNKATKKQQNIPPNRWLGSSLRMAESA